MIAFSLPVLFLICSGLSVGLSETHYKHCVKYYIWDRGFPMIFQLPTVFPMGGQDCCKLVKMGPVFSSMSSC